MSIGPRIGNISRQVDVNLVTTPFKKQISNTIAMLILATTDIMTVVLSLIVAYLTRLHILPYFYSGFSEFNIESLIIIWWFPLLISILLIYEGMYYKRFPFWDATKQIIKAITYSMIIAVLFIFLSKTSDFISRTLLVLTYIYCLILLPFSRLLVKQILFRMRIWEKPVIIMGAGKTAELIIKGFNREYTMGYRPIGLLEDDPEKICGINNGKELIPVLGRFADLEEVIKKTGVKDVVIAAPGMDDKKMVQLTNRLQQMSANVMLVPDLFGIPLSGINVECLFDEKTLFLTMRNNLASPWNRFLKRAFDLVVGGICLIFAVPVMLMIAIAIKVDSKGPVIYAHERVGKFGRKFKCLKFRTMAVNSQEILKELLDNDPKMRREWEQEFKLKNDPRITRVGKFLRKSSLDELPQIINVLVNQMSLVGPRPIIDDEVEKYGCFFDYFKMVPPGISGLWQINGRNDIDYAERVQLDVWYARNWSLWLDFTILVRTITVVLKSKGAY
ncbi:undecaprenyl-phosphate galactose phosphotransferase WbaP [Desulforamulus aquiferis]|uniref:Undecaprenyl-phosphate galactose phosphotransferase WbaP n=1 Tax=Desulforamulus aquiferis TaxID=1397668 RepID=A0AAW7ZCK2_9FIRM|nr:undecaprenyl-phosphate galactose phosphotransferase WbaP [Desulforamulus aquiferis]MDO7786846.1 undecaprenyl-phosphate galactose phosphotransferase WbaP [Desulforamulus aquiferis]